MQSLVTFKCTGRLEIGENTKGTHESGRREGGICLVRGGDSAHSHLHERVGGRKVASVWSGGGAYTLMLFKGWGKDLL